MGSGDGGDLLCIGQQGSIRGLCKMEYKEMRASEETLVMGTCADALNLKQNADFSVPSPNSYT